MKKLSRLRSAIEIDDATRVSTIWMSAVRREMTSPVLIFRK